MERFDQELQTLKIEIDNLKSFRTDSERSSNEFSSKIRQLNTDFGTFKSVINSNIRQFKQEILVNITNESSQANDETFQLNLMKTKLNNFDIVLEDIKDKINNIHKETDALKRNIEGEKKLTAKINELEGRLVYINDLLSKENVANLRFTNQELSFRSQERIKENQNFEVKFKKLDEEISDFKRELAIQSDITKKLRNETLGFKLKVFVLAAIFLIILRMIFVEWNIRSSFFIQNELETKIEILKDMFNNFQLKWDLTDSNAEFKNKLKEKLQINPYGIFTSNISQTVIITLVILVIIIYLNKVSFTRISNASQLRLLKENTRLSLEYNRKRESVPPGFIYVQYPSQLPPDALWESYNWEEVTSKYSNSFFRALGGDTSAFQGGAFQTGWKHRFTDCYGRAQDVSLPGNMAIRIWKRDIKDDSN